MTVLPAASDKHAGFNEIGFEKGLAILIPELTRAVIFVDERLDHMVT